MAEFRKRRTGREGIYTRVVPNKRRSMQNDWDNLSQLWQLSDEGKAQNPRCPECAHEMVYEEREDSLEYKGVINSYMMLAWWCTSCPEAIFEGKPLADREKAYLEFKRKVDSQ